MLSFSFSLAILFLPFKLARQQTSYATVQPSEPASQPQADQHNLEEEGQAIEAGHRRRSSKQVIEAGC